DQVVLHDRQGGPGVAVVADGGPAAVRLRERALLRGAVERRRGAHRAAPVRGHAHRGAGQEVAQPQHVPRVALVVQRAEVEEQVVTGLRVHGERRRRGELPVLHLEEPLGQQAAAPLDGERDGGGRVRGAEVERQRRVDGQRRVGVHVVGALRGGQPVGGVDVQVVRRGDDDQRLAVGGAGPGHPPPGGRGGG